MFVAVASVSSSAPPVPKDKTGVRHLEELHILFAVHRNYPRVLVYAKNTNGLNPSGWIQVKTLMPHQATADALTAAADMALSYARKYEQVHEQT